METLAQSFNQTLESLTGHPTPAHLLYDGLDTASLSWPEQMWVKWYQYWGNPVIATGVMSFLLHEIVYFGRSIPWMIIDSMPSMRKYKLQPVRGVLIAVTCDILTLLFFRITCQLWPISGAARDLCF